MSKNSGNLENSRIFWKYWDFKKSWYSENSNTFKILKVPKTMKFLKCLKILKTKIL